MKTDKLCNKKYGKMRNSMNKLNNSLILSEILILKIFSNCYLQILATKTPSYVGTISKRLNLSTNFLHVTRRRRRRRCLYLKCQASSLQNERKYKPPTNCRRAGRPH